MRHPPGTVTLIAVLMLPSGLAAQTPAPQQPPPSPCTTDSTYRQFDFWVGEWSVRPAAAPATAPAGALPQSRVEKILNGCVLLENWMPPNGAAGKSFTSESPGPNGRVQRTRMTFFNLAPDRVRQLWESSADSGRTWTVTFDGMYTRKP